MPDGTRAPAKADLRAKQRARAVRAVVFMTRLFEYECRDLGVSLAQYRMLLYLRHGPRRAGELAAQASITRPSLSTLIATLERQGLVKRESVDGDRRGVRLELTREGVRAIARVETRFGAVLDDVSSGEGQEVLLQALERLLVVLHAQVATRVRADE